MTAATLVRIFLLALSVRENVPCHLHTCFNCTVFCEAATVITLSNMQEIDCIEAINNSTVKSAELDPVKMECYLSDSTCMTYNPQKAGNIAYAYRCTEGCYRYSLTGMTGIKVTSMVVSEIQSELSGCINYCIRRNCLMFDISTVQECRMFGQCEQDYSCITKQSSSGDMAFKRICAKVCPEPHPPLNGNMFIANFNPSTLLMYPDIVTYTCDWDYELIGSFHATCGVNGKWTTPTPKCVSQTTSSSSHVSSTTTSSLTTTSAATTSTAVPVTTTTTLPTTSTTPSTSTTATTTAAATSTSSTTSIIQLTNFSAGTNYSSATALKIRPIYIVPCLCNEKKEFADMSEESIIAKLIQDTAVDPKLTSMSQNKLISMPDSRISSKIIGLFGAGILIGCSVILVSCDVMTFVTSQRQFVVNKK